jgi:hypothetical protein
MNFMMPLQRWLRRRFGREFRRWASPLAAYCEPEAAALWSPLWGVNRVLANRCSATSILRVRALKQNKMRRRIWLVCLSRIAARSAPRRSVIAQRGRP